MESRASEYFASMNPMANRIMTDIEEFRRRYGSRWEQLDVREQDDLLDAALIREDVRARYKTRAQLLGDGRPEVPCFPRMKIQPGQKIVHFKEEDIKWQDEHSAPFSWETKSQIDLSLSDFPPLGSQSLSEATPNMVTRPAPSRGHAPSGGVTETLSPARRGGADGVEFGKGPSGPLAARLAGESVRIGGSSGSIDDGDDDYECSSLTPSQIKLLERDGQERNGRFDSSGTGREKAGQEAPWVKRQPITIPGGGSLVLGGSEVEQLPRWNRQNSDSRSEPPMLSENLLPVEPQRPPRLATPPKSAMDSQDGLGQGEDVFAPVVSEDQNGKVTLKTGFDFLDNW
uniref:uncharacterized protein C1orf198 homolog n=1 Tax=Myxine glutinosa TaxID=7769 RepID=UPI00358F1F39